MPGGGLDGRLRDAGRFLRWRIQTPGLHLRLARKCLGPNCLFLAWPVLQTSWKLEMLSSRNKIPWVEGRNVPRPWRASPLALQ